jgi:predicted tellurium resistance membrane protein TerC
MEWIFDPQVWVALVSLTAIEIVLGIDNIVFIAILASRLPPGKRDRARVLGLALAMITRIALLFSLTLLMRLTAPLFSVLGREISGRDLILLAGGLFLLAKATSEIHDKLESAQETSPRARAATFTGVIVQIALLDIVFSFDSVVTAIGLAEHLGVMVTAIVIAIIFMMAFSGSVTRFIDHHPTIKMLALSFLLLIGLSLVADALDMHIPKGYIYFAMAFSVFVEMLNLRLRGRSRTSRAA